MLPIQYRRRAAGLASLCLLLAPGKAPAQPLPAPPAVRPVAAAEYFFDTDPGFGRATPIPLSPGTDVTATFATATGALPAGIHRLYIRTRDAAGAWGLTNMQLMYVAPGTLPIRASVPDDVAGLEYFIDREPGFGRGAGLGITPGSDVRCNGSINTGGLTAGIHHIYLRARSSGNSWGLTNQLPVYVVPSFSLPAVAGGPVARAEYFVDTDPGFGKATAIPLTPGTDVTVSGFAVSLGALGPGVHQLVFRAADAAGNWGLTSPERLSVVVAKINIPAPAPAQNITTLEYFFDTDPGFGNGTLLTVPATANLSNYSFAADVTALGNGPHTLFVRTTGPVSQTALQSFRIASPLPLGLLHFAARREGPVAQLAWETAPDATTQRFVVERSADGAAFSAIGSVSRQAGLSAASYAFTDAKPLAGSGYYRLRQEAPDGGQAYSRTIALRFDAEAGGLSVNNPVRDELRVFSAGGLLPGTAIGISNASGNEVLRRTAAGRAVEQLDVRDLPAGSYLLRVQIAGTERILPFVKL